MNLILHVNMKCRNQTDYFFNDSLTIAVGEREEKQNEFGNWPPPLQHPYLSTTTTTIIIFLSFFLSCLHQRVQMQAAHLKGKKKKRQSSQLWLGGSKASAVLSCVGFSTVLTKKY